MFAGAQRGRDVVKALQKKGWNLVRTTGSHRVFARADQRYIFAFKDSDDIGAVMLSRIAKQTGISPSDF